MIETLLVCLVPAAVICGVADMALPHIVGFFGRDVSGQCWSCGDQLPVGELYCDECGRAPEAWEW